MNKKKKLTLLGDILGVSVAIVIFILPFLFMIMNSLKARSEANLLNMSWPKEIMLKNYMDVLKKSNYLLITAFKNSGILTLGSVLILILVCSMAGYVLQRRKDRSMSIINLIILSGLMVPPAIMPSIWLMQLLHIYKTLPGMILLEVALQIPFTIMLYRGFMSSIPIEMEEAGYIDGCSTIRMYFSIVLPLLKPVTATVIILNAVSIFNDFTNPLYFLPGQKNATVQLTLYNFMGQYASSYNMLFADVILITIPMLILFMVFNKKIVQGMVAGAVKG